MTVIEWYFAFYPPSRESFWRRLGHVDAFGYTQHDTWVFFDPQRSSVDLRITHVHDEVEGLMALRYEHADEIIRISARKENSLPPVVALNCVSACGHLVGIRAFRLSTLRNRLLANGGLVIHARECPKGKSEGQGRAPA